MVLRMSSSQMISATSARLSVSASSLAWVMNRLADRMRLTPEALIAAFRFISPEVKFSITGTRPMACRP